MTSSSDRGSFALLVAANTVCATAAFTEGTLVTHSSTVRLPWIAAGTAIFLAGLALRQASHRAQRFNRDLRVDVPAGRGLATTGLYRRLRHPNYAGIALMTAGLAVGGRSLSAVAFWLLGVLPALAYRIRVEDRALFAAFGDEFRRYREAVPAFWPRRRR